MHVLTTVRHLTSLTVVIVAFGCTDVPTANNPAPETSAADFFDREPAPGFDALEWLHPVKETIEVRQRIGPAGGVVRLRRTGIEIHFPAGAVSESVMVEARALPGSVVAFEFGAQGLASGVSVEIRIDRSRLSGSWVAWDEEEALDRAGARHPLPSLLGVHFVGGGTSDVTPVETYSVRLDDGAIVFELTDSLSKLRGDIGDHPRPEMVAGYAVASG